MATLTIEMPPHVTQAQMMQALDALGCELRLASDGRNYKAIPKEGAFSGKGRHLKRIAQAHREAWGYQGGYVLLFKGEVCGWKQVLDCLRVGSRERLPSMRQGASGSPPAAIPMTALSAGIRPRARQKLSACPSASRHLRGPHEHRCLGRRAQRHGG